MKKIEYYFPSRTYIQLIVIDSKTTKKGTLL